MIHNNGSLSNSPISPNFFVPTSQVLLGCQVTVLDNVTNMMKQHSVLLVDDDAGIRLAVADLLELEGIEITQAADGATAVALYRDLFPQIDLVLLDLIMVGMSGLETFQVLKQINPQVKVVLSSGMGPLMETMTFEGIVGYVSKPYDLQTLVDEIRRHLD